MKSGRAGTMAHDYIRHGRKALKRADALPPARSSCRMCPNRLKGWEKYCCSASACSGPSCAASTATKGKQVLEAPRRTNGKLGTQKAA
jgi:hypothetical protein